MITKKIKRKKFNILKLILIILILYVLGYIAYLTLNIPIKNIYIINNELLNDQEIIDQAKISNYPSFLMTTSNSIKEKLLKSPYIKKVRIDKKWFGKLYIYITEYKALLYNKGNNAIVLENKKVVLVNKNINDIPILLNAVPDVIYEKFINKMKEVDESVKIKISEIEYKPVEVDKERFLLKMNDGNYVYLTVYKFEQINKYNQILPTLENKKGILYLDSGNYFEIFK